jgi:hypothetical protein
VIARLSPTLRKALALGLLLLSVLVVEAAAVTPWLDWRAAIAARTASTEALLARTRAAIATDLPAASDIAADTGLLLDAADESLAAAQLQTLLRAAASAETLTIASMQIEPARVEPGARRIFIRMGLSGGFAPLLRLMARLESGRPVLRIGGLEMQTTGTGGDPALTATLEVAALMPPASP